jgi:hypothetical protein
VLDVYSEVVGPAGELGQRGMPLPMIDQEVMTLAGFARRLTVRDIDRTGHVSTRRETSAAGAASYPTRIEQRRRRHRRRITSTATATSDPAL